MERILKTIKLPLFIWLGFMILGSSLPGDKIPEVVSFWEWDKVAHCIEFIVLSILLFRYLHINTGKPLQRAFWLCVVIGILYAGIDELHQLFIPKRDCSLFDFIADSIGVFVGTSTVQYYYRQPLKPYLIACSDKAQKTLYWNQHYGLDEIIKTAWNWQQKMANKKLV
jgi:VanZ family protein